MTFADLPKIFDQIFDKTFDEIFDQIFHKIFDKLFGEEDLTAKRQRITDDQEVVRALYRDMEQLQGRGNQGAKIDSYRSVIAELEAQLKHEEFWLNAQKPEVPNTLSEDGEFPFSTKVKNLLELSKLAFQTLDR